MAVARETGTCVITVLLCQFPDLKNLKVHLLTKEKEVARFNAAATVRRELAKELEFQVRIWKYG